MAVTQVGSILGYFSRSSAYLGLLFATRLQPKLLMTPAKYERLHFFARPFSVASRVTHYHRFPRLVVKYVDLPILFYPFMSKDFYFQSHLHAPPALCGGRYAFTCVIAADRFLKCQRQESKTCNVIRGAGNEDGIWIVVGGRRHKPQFSYFWWALTQPHGSYWVRVAAYLFGNVLRLCCSEVMLDVTSFSPVAKSLSEFRAAPHHVVLAPTHRSIFDSFLLSFALFSIPELQIDLPSVAVADES